jgi:hypothetical protein
MAEQALKENHTHIRYLEALVALECEERDRHGISVDAKHALKPTDFLELWPAPVSGGARPCGCESRVLRPFPPMEGQVAPQKPKRNREFVEPGEKAAGVGSATCTILLHT